MNKLINYLSILLSLSLTLILLAGCGTTSVEKNNTSSNENTAKITEKSNGEKQNNEISAETVLANVKSLLENEAPTGYSLIEYKPFYFTGQKLPEVYALYRPETASEGESTINIIRVYQYDINSNEWKIVYKQSLENRLQVSAGEAIKLTQDKREQAVISVQEGSGAYLSYILLGSKDGKTISALLDSFNNETDPVYFQGNYKFIGNKYLVFYESDRIAAVYQWGTSGLEKVDPSSIPELSSTTTTPKDENNDDIVIKYSVNKNEEIEANVPHQETIFGEVGQKILLVREDANTSDVNARILYSAQNDPYSIDTETGEILAPDIITVTIIPNGYDWDKAFEVYINALDDTIVTPHSDDYMSEVDSGEYNHNLNNNNTIVGDADCSDFATQAEAQAFFEAAGPGDPHDLDRDGDGMACDAN
ncbi:excalibur calcium-binding domain-containing protein [Thermaerobacillus caldiproteolyticus]|uniref:excalibur calcium-binding domain-containing protein n=1 Tax=Thermaerobacillus caldiproteolyticus TaxID=247480 RepID=UPI0018F242AA|nr:excalibur calcium-binding domain-containing protein [Anoxybacillus caldiproteolyticus]